MSSAVRGCHINEPVTQCCCTVFYLLECVVAVPSWLFAVFLDVPMYLQRENEDSPDSMHRYTHWLEFEKKNCCLGSRLTRLANANAPKANQTGAR